MRNLLKGAFYMMLAIALISCSDDEEYVEPILDVTPNNIAGEWCLESWNDAPLAEGSYVYISFERADRTYTLYQNVDSAPARTLTGRYYITTDMELGAVAVADCLVATLGYGLCYISLGLGYGRVQRQALGKQCCDGRGECASCTVQVMRINLLLLKYMQCSLRIT